MNSIESLRQFARMAFWGAAFDLAVAIKDKRSGFAAQDKYASAIRQLRYLYRHAKLSGIVSEVLPVVRETVAKYRK